jgi:predicted permease
MYIINILLPDFLLILLGFILLRVTNWSNDFWSGMEKLVYYVLFPALLFYSTSRAPLDFATSGNFLQIGLLTCASGILLGWLAKLLFRPADMVFESGVQTAFRFNSYIGLAVAARLAGEHGAALMALLIGFAVPLTNMAAVHALVKKDDHFLLEMIKNPLLMGTVAGITFNLLDLHMPDAAGAFLSRLGNASIALGLMMVGAGLQIRGLHASKGIAAYFLAVKLLLIPAIAYGLGLWLALPPLQLQLVVLFAALPTASSAYVLAVRMGGNGGLVAFLISASTILSMLTLSFWLAILR